MATAAPKKPVVKPPAWRATKDLDLFVTKNADGSGWTVVKNDVEGAHQLQVADIPFIQEWGVRSRNPELVIATLAASQMTLMKTTTKNAAGESIATIDRAEKPPKMITSGLVTGLLGCMQPDDVLHHIVAFHRIMAKADKNAIAAASLAVFVNNAVSKAPRTAINSAVDYLGAKGAAAADAAHITMPRTDDVDGEPSTTLSQTSLMNMFTTAVASSQPIIAMGAVYILWLHTCKDVKNRVDYHLPLVEAPDTDKDFVLLPDTSESMPASGNTVFRTTLRTWCNLVLEQLQCKENKSKKKDVEEGEKAPPSKRQLVKRIVTCFFNIIPACGSNPFLAVSSLCVFLCRHQQWADLNAPAEEDYTQKTFIAGVKDLNDTVTKLVDKNMEGFVFPNEAFTMQTSIGRLEHRTVDEDLEALALALGETSTSSVEDEIVAEYATAFSKCGMVPRDLLLRHLQSYGLAGSKKLRHQAVKEGGGVSPKPKAKRKAKGGKSVAKLVTLDPLPIITLGEGLKVEQLWRWSQPKPRGNKVDWYVMRMVDEKSEKVSFWGLGVPTSDGATFNFQTNLDAARAVFDCPAMGIQEVEYSASEPPIALWKLPFKSDPPTETIENVVGDDAEFVDFANWEGGRVRELQDVYSDMFWSKTRAVALLRLLALRSLTNVNNNNFTTIYFDKETDAFTSLDMPATNRKTSWDETTPWTGVLFKGTRKPSVKFLEDTLYPHLQEIVDLLKGEKCKGAVDDSLFEFAINGQVRARGLINEMAAALEASIKSWDPTTKKPAPKKKQQQEQPAKKRRKGVSFEDEDEGDMSDEIPDAIE